MRCKKNQSAGFMSCALLVMISALMLGSCQNKPKFPTSSATTGLILKCFRLDSAGLQRVLGSRTSPADTAYKANQVLLQIFSAADTSYNFGLIGYSAKSYTSVDTTTKTTLQTIDSCTQNFTGELIIGNNFFSLKDLDEIDKSADLTKRISYITFKPMKGPSNYLVYDIEVTYDKTQKFQLSSRTDPCPPYCRTILH